MSATVVIKSKKARPFFGRHPWVFESAIDKVEGSPQPGDCVRVISFEKEFIGHGLYNPHSNIRVRLLSWDKARPIDEELIAERISRAVEMRQRDLGLGDPRGACRLIFSESDGLSGLTVDRYAELVVIQWTSLAMTKFQSVVVATLERLLSPRGIYCRTERNIGELEKLEIRDGPIAGEIPDRPIVIAEHSVEYLVDVRAGQKTGAFLDQRDNRLALCRYTPGRDLLDLFCYSGGFSLVAKKLGGAAQCIGVDASGSAVLLAQQNAERNELAVEYLQGDAMPALEQFRREDRRFGVIVCDPPKFARTASAVEKATKAYEQLNRLAIERLLPGGILLTCSCSGHVTMPHFLSILAESARRAERDLVLLEQRGQAPDHPVSAFCLETSYLKCVIARAS